MKIIIRARNLILDKKTEDYINKKIGSLEKFFNMCHTVEEWEKIKSSCEIFVEVKRKTRHHKKGLVFEAKVNVRLPGKTLIAEADEETLTAAIDNLKDEFEREIKKYKTKKIDLERKKEGIQKKSFIYRLRRDYTEKAESETKVDETKENNS